MSDTLTPEKRSELMSRIRSKNTKPEIRVRSILHSMGYRFRLHGNLPGRPDIVLPKHRTAVLVHGCFWHQHPGCSRQPKTRKSFWKEKFSRNKERDKQQLEALGNMGWNVVVVWECELKKNNLADLRDRLEDEIEAGSKDERER